LPVRRKVRWSSKNGQFRFLSSLFKKPHFLKLSWAEIAKIRMTPSAVVKHLYIVNDILPGLLSGPVVREEHPFSFQTAEKT
jgi:hypothetical protein